MLLNLRFLSYRTQLHYEVAVDFSSAAHDTDQNRFDADLQMAIRAIGGILRDYTPNRLFSAFGMGAKIPPTFQESYEFHLNFNVDATCRGLDGVIEAYRKAQGVVIPSKTSKFAPVVSYATRMSYRSGFRGLHYHVLTIFSRGTPTDLKELSAALASASDAPLSVIIVGIGNGDFSQLLKLSLKRKEGTRACLQFIAMDDILDVDSSPSENRSRLAQKALCLIPQQMTDFMHSANIAAKPPIQACRSPLFHCSSLIPDRPSQFFFDGQLPKMHSPQMHRSDRRGSDSQYLDAEIGARNHLNVRVPERCHSVLQTSREQYQRRLKERGLGRVCLRSSSFH
ncbi:Copine [Dictyocaulus viviparus]|uniref:Copine n=1 Tax=Dictyocaulus viviparus TaxID=29172 RepID=A0A0D8XSS5_DICVI|nr:Copine [Dictyocaulus viviparus]